jgi:hypothetical protein
LAYLFGYLLGQHQLISIVDEVLVFLYNIRLISWSLYYFSHRIKKNPEKNSTIYALIVMALVKVVARKKDQKKSYFNLV